MGSDQLKISHTTSEFVFVSFGEISRVFVSLAKATDFRKEFSQTMSTLNWSTQGESCRD